MNDVTVDLNDLEKKMNDIPERKTFDQIVEEKRKLIDSRFNQNTTASVDKSKALGINLNKLDFTLIPMDAQEEVVRVLMHGKDKYEPWNWAINSDEFQWTKTMAKARRHLNAFDRCEDE